MPAINFQSRFAPLVADGSKRTTIRLWRKRPFQVGDRLYLYTGQRTKLCRKLGEAVCIDTAGITISEDDIEIRNMFVYHRFGMHNVKSPEILSSSVTLAMVAEIITRDGFVDFDDMKKWFRHTHGLPFEGQIVFWDTPDAA